MTILICLLAALSLTGIGLLFYALRFAPEGYEDELGFHYPR